MNVVQVTIPASFEAHLALGDGSVGADVGEVLGLTSSQVANLYSCSLGQFNYCFQEHGVAYGETAASEMRAEVTFSLPPDASLTFSLTLSNQPVEKWGINFAGSVLVRHKTGEERVVYLPGTRTYDPAGITGDPHASERIGPSCSRTQLAVSLSQLVAAGKGALSTNISLIQEKTRPLIQRYHGREALFDWMIQQISEAVYQNKEVTPYPDFLRQRIAEGKLELGPGREHTQVYLESHAAGKACPPVQYYRKVAAKDKTSELLSGEKLTRFNTIIS